MIQNKQTKNIEFRFYFAIIAKYFFIGTLLEIPCELLAMKLFLQGWEQNLSLINVFFRINITEKVLQIVFHNIPNWHLLVQSQ